MSSVTSHVTSRRSRALNSLNINLENEFESCTGLFRALQTFYLSPPTVKKTIFDEGVFRHLVVVGQRLSLCMIR